MVCVFIVRYTPFDMSAREGGGGGVGLVPDHASFEYSFRTVVGAFSRRQHPHKKPHHTSQKFAAMETRPPEKHKEPSNGTHFAEKHHQPAYNPSTEALRLLALRQKIEKLHQRAEDVRRLSLVRRFPEKLAKAPAQHNAIVRFVVDR